MAKKKKKGEVIVEVKGLPYNDKIQFILNIIVVAMLFVCLLTLVLPVFRFWYPLSTNPTYTNFFVPGYAFIFGDKIKDVSSETSTRLLTVRFELQVALCYIMLLLASVLTGLKYIKKFENNKKLLSLFVCILLAVAFVLVFNHIDALVTTLRGYKVEGGSQVPVSKGEFTFFGILMLVFLGLGSLISLYQACCEKIVKK